MLVDLLGTQGAVRILAELRRLDGQASAAKVHQRTALPDLPWARAVEWLAKQGLVQKTGGGAPGLALTPVGTQALDLVESVHKLVHDVSSAPAQAADAELEAMLGLAKPKPVPASKPAPARAEPATPKRSPKPTPPREKRPEKARAVAAAQKLSHELEDLLIQAQKSQPAPEGMAKCPLCGAVVAPTKTKKVRTHDNPLTGKRCEASNRPFAEFAA